MRVGASGQCVTMLDLPTGHLNKMILGTKETVQHLASFGPHVPFSMLEKLKFFL
jgi:hypothetical protein